MSILDFGLKLDGMDDKTIAQIDAALPALERLAAAWIAAEPCITALIPIITKALPDAVAVAPVIKAVITFEKQKEGES